MLRLHPLVLSFAAAFGALQLGRAFAAEGAAPIPPADAAAAEHFEKHVRPILIRRCYECHSGVNAKGGLLLDTKAGWQRGGDGGPAVVPAKPSESPLVAAIQYEGLEMPPKEKGGKLPAEEIAALVKWVETGAFDPREAAAKIGGMTVEQAKTWWSFQPPALAAEPLTSEWIDALLDAELARHGEAPTPPADKRTLLRRAAYDLTGLPPTAEEVERFLADESPDAFAKEVERLLASPQYGEQWGRRWLDVVRYADTAGENTDRPLPHAWRYRNWVFDAFRNDLPYDEFARLQIAGDVLRFRDTPQRRKEGIVATGWLAVARRFGHDIDQDVHLTHEDVLDNLGKNFLGLSIGCARCHDHKYDAVTAADYYALYGILQSTKFAFPGCEPKGRPRDLVPLSSPEEAEAVLRPWKEKAAAYEAEKVRRAALATPPAKLKALAAAATQTLGEGNVGEGKSIELRAADGAPLAEIPLRKHEALQLAVGSNDSHGADSTLVEWTIEEVGGKQRKWSAADLVSNLTEGNPHSAAGDATWCFLETTDGPVFLSEKKESILGNSALRSWSLGSEPSVFVNASRQQVMVWTTLSARTFFVHPGPKRPVAVAWIAPDDGVYRVAGRVADAHPSGSDGVSWKLERIASAEYGQALVATGRALGAALAEPGPPPELPVAYAVVEGTPKAARVQLRGDPEKLGEEVPRRWLSAFGGELVPPEGGSGRRKLAEWVAEHPLAARVMVNRIWQGHFGQGLVRTPNDFGARGDSPSHPELLEALSRAFLDRGRSVKQMHRLMMNTRAYQRSGRRTEALLASDPENRRLGRFARRRLTAEELRDSLLLVGGKLDLRPGEAHPFPPEKQWNYTQHNPFSALYETDKRSVYLMVQRQRRHPFLALFDGADPNASTPVRQSTTAPTQALYFMNDPFFHLQAERFARSLLELPDDAARIDAAYRRLFQRSAAPAERARAEKYLAASAEGAPPKEAWASWVRVLLAGNEFSYVD